MASPLHPVVRRLHVVPLVALVFLYLYDRLVCPFMDQTAPLRLLIGLGYVAVFHILMREALLRWLPHSPTRSLSRHGYRIAVASWLGAGLFGVALHLLRYPDFHISSPLKLLLGYWVLGAGILAQLEYSLIERSLRHNDCLLEQAQAMRDRLGRRLLESFAAFTVAPALALILLTLRFEQEGHIIPGVAGELAFIILTFTGGAIYVAWHYGRLLHADAETIVNSLEQITVGSLDVSPAVPRPDEMGRIALGIREMAAGLRQREQMRDLFGRMVSPDVARTLLEEWENSQQDRVLQGQQRDVTVLMADLRGFTPLSETLAPAQLTALLNDWLSRAVRVIEQHGGLVDKFIGDAVMVVFGLYDRQTADTASSPAEQAIRCGQALLDEMTRFNQDHPMLTAPLALGVGIHSGPVVAGTIGSAQRMEFTVIGSTVNTAARLESAARTPLPALLCSAETVAAAGSGIACREVGTIALKGISTPLPVFTA
ncbi:adenylate/guanylate cyclase domain-containing protein [Insolitispirillum peregrinum]|uniref:adenylate/guanylate cyclase domain-containing protein n=1 Tax=Insolitispirillum peregrinum TaxID=80876 RepID=UPI00361D5D9F